MEKLKEHKLFKNQLIAVTVICFVAGWFISEMIFFGVMFGLIALFNIFSYRQNVKDYNLLKFKK